MKKNYKNTDQLKINLKSQAKKKEKTMAFQKKKGNRKNSYKAVYQKPSLNWKWQKITCESLYLEKVWKIGKRKENKVNK